MIKTAIDRIGQKAFSDRIRSLPNHLSFADMFSGAGTFGKVVDVVIRVLKKQFPEEMSHKEVCWLEFGLFWYVLVLSLRSSRVESQV